MPLVAHVIQPRDAGRAEDALVALVDHMPRGTCRHAVVCMTDDAVLYPRIRRDDVSFHGLYRRGAGDLGVYRRLRQLLDVLQPDIVHTRNRETLAAQFVALRAGIPGRVHEVHDDDPSAGRGRMVPFLERFLTNCRVVFSEEQADYLTTAAGLPPQRVARVHLGSDPLAAVEVLVADYLAVYERVLAADRRHG